MQAIGLLIYLILSGLRVGGNKFFGDRVMKGILQKHLPNKKCRASHSGDPLWQRDQPEVDIILAAHP